MADCPEPLDIFEELIHHLDRGEAVAVVTVLHAAGSTPQKTGTRALVLGDGSMVGTIGGGLLESQARDMAIETLRTGAIALFDFRFDGPSAAVPLPVCGGTMRILIDPRPDFGPYRRFAVARRARRAGVLLTRVEAPKANITVEWRDTGRIEQIFLGAMTDDIRKALLHRTPAYRLNDGNAELLIEPATFSPRLIIVGGGHVGQALARQAVMVGFETIVLEDRPEFVEASRFPDGVVARGGDVAEQLAALRIDPDTYIALVSRGHVTDGKALAAAIHSNAAYIGMMGSRRKIALMRKEFVESGRCSAEAFDGIRAPIGLDIGAETVAEIAASIAAELIAARRRKLTRRKAGA